ncbi:KEOPS complex subunit Cgi121 [Pyrococcus yayanosii]|uniref:KEOPS complex Cgi121-like subunit n=1 Tax=Pyrococcus yayanosii (strain CH1 / JCM 16557) TaxID=529709 RepID=F8AGL5_PYRYC|nr:KEOPS complex subunit Cgi121 [Pyrococcus yayanosii]AEH23986.1 hypothetical protein PYCH_02890 [Pyrococcus yayanosii CH1]
MKIVRIERNEEEICIAKIHISDPESLLEILDETMQAVSVECWEEVAFATLLALRAFKNGRAKAKTVKGEILIRLAGTPQIRDAIAKVGARRGKNYLVAFGKGACEKLKDVIQKLKLDTVPISNCAEEELKKRFEEMALVEAK